MNTQQKNNGSDKIAGLPTFNLILADGSREGHLFANGNMQVGVVINIRASTVMAEKPIFLSPEQLDSIELIDKITHEKLPIEWEYDSEENGYLHQIPISHTGARDAHLHSGKNLSSNAEAPQQKIYWLKTKKIGTITITARVTLDGKTFLADDSEHAGSHIVITSYKPIVYHADNFEFITEKSVANGTYDVKLHSDQSTPGPPGHNIINRINHLPWIQNNYYIIPKKESGYPVHDIGEIRNTINDNNPTQYDYRRFTHHTRAEHLYLWFLWGQYSAKRTAGADYRHFFNYERWNKKEVTLDATPQVEITTTPRVDVVSLSRLYFESPYPGFWVDESNQIPQFKLHDIYGNESVVLKIIMDDADTFHLQEG
ncbi:hypothetical protein ID854_20480 [Xenorhabdus sp. M]|uniref:Uncharacterized protein n=1 Tax=Xenorhabdus szentirmaii TaxID=290112 RepID=A0AAW3YZ19_9GAMM|nr:hypothetical protein [Xenorhabdus sp. M]MBD2802751.1 hypothetical protein [Xenorhabdus sp. M]